MLRRVIVQLRVNNLLLLLALLPVQLLLLITRRNRKMFQLNASHVSSYCY